MVGMASGSEMVDSEAVPSSLAEVVPILRAANEIEKQNPRVAPLCKHLNDLFTFLPLINMVLVSVYYILMQKKQRTYRGGCLKYMKRHAW